MEATGGEAAQAGLAAERGQVGDQQSITVRADLLVGHPHPEAQRSRVTHERNARLGLGLNACELRTVGNSGVQRERAARHIEAFRGHQHASATTPVRRSDAPVVQEARAVDQVLHAPVERRGCQCREAPLDGDRSGLTTCARDLAARAGPQADGRGGAGAIPLPIRGPGQASANELALAGVVRHAVDPRVLADTVEAILRTPFVAVLHRRRAAGPGHQGAVVAVQRACVFSADSALQRAGKDILADLHGPAEARPIAQLRRPEDEQPATRPRGRDQSIGEARILLQMKQRLVQHVAQPGERQRDDLPRQQRDPLPAGPPREGMRRIPRHLGRGGEAVGVRRGRGSGPDECRWREQHEEEQHAAMTCTCGSACGWSWEPVTAPVVE